MPGPDDRELQVELKDSMLLEYLVNRSVDQVEARTKANRERRERLVLFGIAILGVLGLSGTGVYVNAIDDRIQSRFTGIENSFDARISALESDARKQLASQIEAAERQIQARIDERQNSLREVVDTRIAYQDNRLSGFADIWEHRIPQVVDESLSSSLRGVEAELQATRSRLHDEAALRGLFFSAISLDVAEGFSSAERDRVLDILEKVAEMDDLDQIPGFLDAYTKILKSFVSADQTHAVSRMETMFPAVAHNRPDLLHVLVTHYGLRVVGGAGSQEAATRLTDYCRNLRDLGFPEAALPWEVLESFRGNMRRPNPETTRLLQERERLTDEERRMMLGTIGRICRESEENVGIHVTRTEAVCGELLEAYPAIREEIEALAYEELRRRLQAQQINGRR